jgi:AbrB family looped-hinge helix DNA binding protein
MTVRVTSRGQVTIPKDIRDRAGIKPGNEVEFRVDGDTIVVERAKGRARPGMSRGEKVVAALRGTATKNRHLSTDEIMKLLRGDD